MKNKSHFITLSIKRNILPSLLVAFTICLVLFSKENLSATKNGLLLWANSVVPALLPFFIATELLGHTNVVSYIGKFLNKFMKPIFNVPGIGAYAFVMGIISGYPIGAKIVTKFRENGDCTKAEAERLLAFTNNSGPLFIIGTVGITMFGNTLIGFLLFITHFLGCIIVGFLFRFWKFKDSENISYKNSSKSTNQNITLSNLGEILSSSIMNSVNSIVIIGGFVILFSVIISILKSSGLLQMATNVFYPFFDFLGINVNFIQDILSGIIELTNGLSSIIQVSTKSISTTFIISSFLLGFGGLSVLLQVLSITSKSDISIKPYFIGKLLHGIISAVLTYIIIHIFPIFNLDIVPIFSSNVNNINPISAYGNYYSLSIALLLFIFTFFLFYKYKNYAYSKRK